jgi:hypothetical protein
MKKFAANYILSESGLLLKNGILIADDDGNVIKIIDTKGDLDETAQLVFLNGILIVNNLYIRKKSLDFAEDELTQFVSLKINGHQQLSTSELIEIAKQIQAEFPELKTPEITNPIYSLLNSSFNKENQAGIFLLVNSDLIGLHFKPQSKLKRIV